jgi:ATP-dependent RNA helicase SUPV3L1/SUV3
MSDGSFGTTADAGAIAPEVVEAVESHEFDALRALYWRSRSHDFSSAKALLRSLERPPPAAQLMRSPPAEDHQALARLAGQPEIARLATDPAAVRLLWEVCQIPDFRKILSDHHARLIAQIYRHLMGDAEAAFAGGKATEGRLAGDWVEGHLRRIDRLDGDIDTLVQRIAHVRTWTYIAHRADWLDDPRHWQERARAIEDRLSDALHDRLTQRFVDRRTATLVRRLAEGGELLGAVRRNGEVLVEGEHVGALDGFRFTPAAEVKGEDARPLMAAARRALSQEIPRRCRQLEADDDGSFLLDSEGRIQWRGAPVARLRPGAGVLAPEIRALDSDLLDGPQRQRIAERAKDWVTRYLANRLGPLHGLAAATEDGRLQGPARGIAYQLVESLGSLPRPEVAAQVDALSRGDRKALSELGVRIGRESLFQPAGLKPEAARLKAVLLACHRREAAPELAVFTAEGGQGFVPVVALPPKSDIDAAMARALGYLRLVPRNRGGRRKAATTLLVRVDRMERIVRAAFGASRVARQADKASRGRFTADGKLLALAGGDVAALSTILGAAGFRVMRGDEGLSAQPQRRRAANASAGANGGSEAGQGPRGRDSDSPFAKLSEWQAAE